jgi:hypothetical protein
MNSIISWVVARATEPSTWAGIAVGATAISHALSGDTASLGVVLASLAAMVLPEAKTKS